MISLMDDYYVTKDDFDAIMEIGLGINDQSKLLSGVSSATKSDFTRTFNKSSHPVPFMSNVDVKTAKVAAPHLKPDSEQVVEDDDYGQDDDEHDQQQGDDDITHDKLIKPKKSLTKKKNVRSK